MILSGSLHAMVNAWIKGGPDKAAGRAATDGASALILLPATLLVPVPWDAAGWLGASAAIHAAYLYALVRAYEVGDFSASYPVLRGVAPLAVAAVPVGVLGEPITPADLLGVALIGGSLVAMVAGRHLGRAGLGWAVLTGCMTAGYTVVDAQGVRAAPTVASYIVWAFVLMGGLTVGMFGAISRGAVFPAMRQRWRAGVVAGTGSIATYGLALTAFSMGPTAPLAALRETGTVTALVLSVVVLRERVAPVRALAALGVLAGAALILVG